MTLISFSPSTTVKSADVNSNFTSLANGSGFTAGATIDSLNLTTLKQVSGLYSNGNSGAAATINFANGDRQTITVSASTTLTFTNAVAGQILTLIVVENGTGNFTVTLPTVKWSGGLVQAFTTTANAINTLTLLYDGTNYLAQLAGGYA